MGGGLMDLGVLKASLGLDVSKFDSGLNKALGGFGKLESKIISINQAVDLATRVFHGFQNTLGKLAKDFIDVSNEAKGYENRLRVLLGSQELANKTFDDVAKYASNSASQIKDLMAAATALSGVLQNPAEEMQYYLKVIDDLAVVSGLSIEETTSQIIRMYSAGASAADLFRERGVLAMLGFKAGVSYTAEETKQMLLDAYISPTSKFRDASMLAIGTLDGQIGMLKDKLFQFKKALMDVGAYQYLVEVLKIVNDYIAQAMDKKKIAIFGQALLDITKGAISKFVEGLNLVNKVFYGWQMLISVFKIAFFKLGEWVWSFFANLRSVTTKFLEIINKFLETINIGGILDKHIAKSKQILEEQKAAIDQYKQWGEEEKKNLDNKIEQYEVINNALNGIKKQIDDINLSATSKENGGELNLNIAMPKAAKVDRSALEAARDTYKEVDEFTSSTAKNLNEELANIQSQKTHLLANKNIAEEIRNVYVAQDSMLQQIDEKLEQARQALANAGADKELSKKLQKDIDKLEGLKSKVQELSQQKIELTIEIKRLEFDEKLTDIQHKISTQKFLFEPDAELKTKIADITWGYDKLAQKYPELTSKLNELKQAEIAYVQNTTLTDGMKQKLAAIEGAFGALHDVFTTVGNELGRALAESFEKGFNFGEFLQNLAKMLRMMAIQKTVTLLFEAAYQRIMAGIYQALAVSTAVANPPLAAAYQVAAIGAHVASTGALAGAAIMGSLATGLIAGMAHSGMQSIPEDGTWLLQKGERVVDNKTNRDLTEFLKTQGRQTPQVNMTVNINGGDEQGVMKALPKLKQTIIDVVSGDIAQNGIIRKTIMSYT